MNVGRRGLPAEVIAEMYADYQSGLSLAEVGVKHNRSRQSMFCVFQARGLALRAKEFKPVVIHNGRKYTPSKGEYLRDTIYRGGARGTEKQLHRVIWEEHYGPIPAGHQVMFKDGDKRNVAIGNLYCAPVREVSALTATGVNQFTQSAKKRLGLLMGNFKSGRKIFSTAFK